MIAIMYDLKYRYIFWFNSEWYLLILFIFSLVIIILSISVEILFLKKINLNKYTLILPLVCTLDIFGGKYISKYQADLSQEKAKSIFQS